jgi:hypothetical protein
VAIEIYTSIAGEKGDSWWLEVAEFGGLNSVHTSAAILESVKSTYARGFCPGVLCVRCEAAS